MSWDQVARYLSGRFRKEAKILDWIKSLPSSPDGELLGVCLAIDIASKALDPSKVAEILRLIDDSVSDRRYAFHLAVDKHGDRRNLLCASLLTCSRLKGQGHYTRILPVESFITYFVGPSMPAYLPLSPSAKAKIRRRYLGAQGGTLEGIDRWWGGRRGVTWVLSSAALEGLASKHKEKIASVINDATGLGYPLGTELMLVRYPRGFDAFIQVKQPTSLDSSWEQPGNFFVSFGKDDGWGRTHSCSSTRPGMRERVHGEIKNPTRNYRTEDLGTVEELEIDRAGLVIEGYKRFFSLMAKTSQG